MVPPPSHVSKDKAHKVEWYLKPAPFSLLKFKREGHARDYQAVLEKAHITNSVIMRREYTEDGYVHDEREVK